MNFFSEWYDKNKEPLSQKTTEEKCRESFLAGVLAIEDMIPSLLQSVIGLGIKVVPIDNGEFAAGIGNYYIKGKSPVMLIAALTSMAMEAKEKKIVTATESDLKNLGGL